MMHPDTDCVADHCTAVEYPPECSIAVLLLLLLLLKTFMEV